jgi:hypothetical protein
MKIFRCVVILMCLTFAVIPYTAVNAQCSMCTLNAENSVQNGNTQGKGLNNGILYLLAMPYIAVAAIGFIWYRRYRRKDVVIDIKEEKII